ncbi:hypothetical protein [Arthrobacter sp.]|uniref:hypothetical protein n=1 Tax=Arthrobacter sp. TaxID=1667 RepID=UPI0026DF328F|nr:hypothetical protein [Arthrobacter sp.]MDO5754364.1 hypothetical protein [Arthrobacter sp.]
MDINTLTQQAEDRLTKDRDAKVASVVAAGKSGAALAEAREFLAAAEREHNLNHAAALRHGWSAKDLKEMGIEAATKQANGRPKRQPAASAAE